MAILNSIIDFDNVAAAKAASAAWWVEQDYDKVYIVDMGIYDFETVVVGVPDDNMLIAVTGGYLIKVSDVSGLAVASLSSSTSTSIAGNVTAITSLSTSTLTALVTAKSAVSSLSSSVSGSIAGNVSTVASLSTSVSTIFAREVAAFVALNTSVTLDNIKIEARLTGGQGFRIGTVTGTVLCSIAVTNTYATDAVFGSNRPNLTLNTTMTHPFGWTGQTDADSMWGHIHDRTNSKFYEFNVMTNTAPTLSFVRIKRIL